MLKAIGIAAVLLVSAPVAWGQSSQEAPRQNTESPQQRAESTQRGTEDAPFVVQIRPTTGQKQEKTNPSAGERQDEWLEGWTAADKIAATAAIAAFLQFLALATTVCVLIVTARRQLRAYVFPDNAGLYEGTVLDPALPEHANEPGIVLNWKNSGQTPARRVVSWAQMNVIEPINEDRLIVPQLQESFYNNLGGGATGNKSFWFGRALTATEIADVIAGTRAIYLFGRIEYRDVFGTKRFTDFRFRYTGKFPPVPGAMLSICEKGNEAN
jgi:hypothetical protein